MRFGILGPTQVWHADGRDVPIGGSQLRALLALLLADAGQVVPAERLIDDLYGATPPQSATNALQSQVSRLRRILAGAGAGAGAAHGAPVEFHPTGYRLTVDPDAVDAHRFVRLASAGRSALAAGRHAAAAALLTEALTLWRGPALVDAGEAPTARPHAARLEELRLTAAEDRVDAELALDRHPSVVAELRQLIAAHPLRERPRAQLIRALYADGRQAEALAAFTDARRTLAEQLGVDPSPELAALHLAVLRGDPAPGRDDARADGRPGQEPPSGSGPGPRPEPPAAQPPAQLTSFIGRDEELARVDKLLAESRLVTLTGPGGAGKTRLAVEAATRRGGHVGFVELAPLAPEADVAQAILTALGMREPGLLRAGGAERPLYTHARLVAALADRPLLLVLDNCEHVVASAAAVADVLLRACPRLRILATSRETLGITGETLCPVPPLALPPPGAVSGDAIEYPAVRLFLDRAGAVRPDLVWDESTTATVQRVCRTLDGLPLAIELAAARLRSLPLDEVAARLDDRFALLSRGSRAAAPRHRTLRAVVEWSWALLTDAERRLARRFSCFAGGAGLAAVEAVCGVPGADPLEALTGLVEKSLVEAQPGGRYRMLETVRALAEEKLVEAGEAAAVQAGHAAYFLDLARAADPHLRRAEQLDWLHRLDADRDNLNAAVRRSIDAGDTATAMRQVAYLSAYWWLRGRRGEGAALARTVLAALTGPVPDELAEEYAVCLLNAMLTGTPEPGRPNPVDTAGAILHGLSRQTRYPFLNVLHGMAAGPPPADVVAVLRQHQISDDPWMQALADYGFGAIALYAGRATEAEVDFRRGLGGFRAVGERWGTAACLAELAVLAHWRGDWAAAGALADEALELAAELNCVEDLAAVVCKRAAATVGSGDLAAAEADYRQAADIARRAGAAETLAEATSGLAEVARLRGDLAGARAGYEQALAQCPDGWFSADHLRSYILIGLGRVAEQQGDAVAARGLYRRALAWPPPTGEPVEYHGHAVAAMVAEGLAGVALLAAEPSRAARLLGAATVLRGILIAGDPDVERIRNAAHAALGDEGYTAAYTGGAALNQDDALELVTRLTVG